jgi:hypothetical protein
VLRNVFETEREEEAGGWRVEDGAGGWRKRLEDEGRGWRMEEEVGGWRKRLEDGENCTVGSSMICTHHEILLE